MSRFANQAVVVDRKVVNQKLTCRTRLSGRGNKFLLLRWRHDDTQSPAHRINKKYWHSVSVNKDFISLNSSYLKREKKSYNELNTHTHTHAIQQ